MRMFIPVLIVYFVLAACSGMQPTTVAVEGPHTLELEITGIKCCQGSLRIAVYNSKEKWLKKDGMIRGRIIIVQSNREVLKIQGLIADWYAIGVYQDINSNGKLDRWFGVIPKEPYGFSNSINKFRPPSFDEAKINFPVVSNVRVKLNAIGF